jgi:nitrogen fixation protein FixH
MAHMLISPAHPGWNDLKVLLMEGDGAPVKSTEVTVEYSLPADGIEPIPRDMKPLGDGFFEHAGPEMTVPGDWTIRVRATIGQFEEAMFETQLEVH